MIQLKSNLSYFLVKSPSPYKLWGWFFRSLLAVLSGEGIKQCITYHSFNRRDLLANTYNLILGCLNVPFFKLNKSI